MDLAHHVEIAGIHVPYSALTVANVQVSLCLIMRTSSCQIGPGIVHMIFDTAFGKAVMIQSVTPEEALFQVILRVLNAVATDALAHANGPLWGIAARLCTHDNASG